MTSWEFTAGFAEYFHKNSGGGSLFAGFWFSTSLNKKKRMNRMQYQYKTKGVCSQSILLDIEGDVIKSVQFIGGCSGNTQGVAALAAGKKASEVIAALEGIRCEIGRAHV